MNTRIIALTSALATAACGGAEPRPAEDPTSRSTVASNTDSVAQTQSAPVRGTTTTTGREVTGTSQNIPPSGMAPTVVNNAGVADQTKNADNTKINDRDRHGALTPMDQGNSGAETTITATIRKGIMGDKSLSFTAKNVKVITVGSKVTLRGPVKSDQERATIETVAKQTAGVSEVDNQLEVKK